MKRSSLLSIIGIGLGLMLLISYPVRAVDIDVACDTADLITAINTANGNGEADTINLAAGCTYSFSTGDATNSDSALPRITSPITINANGATLQRDSGAATDFRLIFVAIGSALTLSDVTLTGGISSLSGGGISSDGILTVTNSTFSDNTATFAGGGISSLGGLTVTDCTFSGNAGQSGGGIYSDAILTVTNSSFSSNSASEGGGIYSSSTTTVTNSTFSGNTAARFGGGGIYNVSGFGTTTVNNSTFSGNTATGSAGDGGGIFNFNGTLTLTDSTLSGNSANRAGGIYNVGTLTLTNSILSGNSASTIGGGIVNSSFSTVTLKNSTLSGNSAYNDGGSIFNNGTMALTNSTFSGNSADDGGGIFNQTGGTLTVTNSTLSGNSANYGGGILNQTGGTLTVTNCTLSGNSANSAGGGILNTGTMALTNSTLSGNSATTFGGGGIYNFATLTVTNSIVWGNSSQISGTATVTYSTVQGGYTGTGNISDDPLFFDQWGPSDAPTIFGDYRLQANSPTLNVGDNAALPADTLDLDGDLDTAEPIPFDRDGNTRVVNSIVDMGAYEHQTVFAQELLDNGGFETDADLNKVPDGWTLANKTGDKLLCVPAKAHSGNCAFKFKGGVPENAKLSQVVNLTGLTFGAGDTLSLSAWFKGASTAAKTKFVLSVTYTGNPIPVKTKLTVKQNAGYTLRSVADYTLTAGGIDQIKVTFQHKSAAGTVYVDDASLLHTLNGPRSRSGAPLPPPAAPQGFRGGN